MERKILLVSDSKGLIVRGIATKLQGLGINTVSSSVEVEDLEEKSEKSDLIILYKEDPEAKILTALHYIKELCVSGGLFRWIVFLMLWRIIMQLPQYMRKRRISSSWMMIRII